MEELLEKFNEEFRGPSMEFFNLKYDSIEGEQICFSCEFNNMSANPMGFVQGGMISAALDDATSAAMIAAYQEKKAPMSTNLNISFNPEYVAFMRLLPFTMCPSLSVTCTWLSLKLSILITFAFLSILIFLSF